jgi:hypothetical protein
MARVEDASGHARESAYAGYAYNFQREPSGFAFYLEIRTRLIVPWFVQAALSMTSAVDAGVEAVFFLGWIFSEKSTC